MICKKLSVYGLFFITASIFLLLSVTCVCANENTNLTDDGEVISDLDKLSNDFENLSSGDVYYFEKDYTFDKISVNSIHVINIAADNVTIEGNNHVIDGAKQCGVTFKVTGNNICIKNLHFKNFITSTVLKKNDKLRYNFEPPSKDENSPISWIGDKGHLEFCTFDENMGYNGGALNWCGNNGRITGCNFTNNKAGTGGALNWCGNNGRITGCNFTNNDAKTGGAVTWTRNNCLINNCTFSRNTAFFGGAITWKGNNGTINNTLFLYNFAHRVGGAIFIGGTTNTISYSKIVNSTTQWTEEAIYMDLNRKNINLKNVSYYKQETLLIDGTLTNIDVETYIYRSYAPRIADGDIDIIPLIYCAITKGGINYLNDRISYYGEYSDKNKEFILSITKTFDDITYTKNFKFKYASCYGNKVFNDVYQSRFETSFIITKNVDIDSQGTAYDKLINAMKYINAIKYTNSMSLLSFIDENHIIGSDKDIIKGKIALSPSNLGNAYPVTLALNINFKEKYDIQCLDSLNLKNSGFDVININGHGSRIFGSGKSSDEFHWVCVDTNKIFSAHDLIIEGYNQAVVNMGGACIFDNITFYKNEVDYYIKKDYGGAILSTGSVICTNCCFENNYAKHGGAIFNQGYLTLENCTFTNNNAYGEGNNICNGKGGIAIVDEKLIIFENNIVHNNHGLTDEEIKTRTILLAGAAIIIGIGVGVVTWGVGAPGYVAGIVGFIGGSCIGAAGAVDICSNSFDINHDRLKTSLILILGCGAVGACAGVLTNIMLNGYLGPCKLGIKAFIPKTTTDAAEVITWNVVSDGKDLTLISGTTGNNIAEVADTFSEVGEEIATNIIPPAT